MRIDNAAPQTQHGPGAANATGCRANRPPVFTLRNPAFSQDKLELAKVQSNASISRRNDNVGGITAREIGRLVYGPDSPIVSLEQYNTIAAITRDDLAAWHKFAEEVYPRIRGKAVPADMFDEVQRLVKEYRAKAGEAKKP